MPPPCAQILSISCSSQENLAKLYAGHFGGGGGGGGGRGLLLSFRLFHVNLQTMDTYNLDTVN